MAPSTTLNTLKVNPYLYSRDPSRRVKSNLCPVLNICCVKLQQTLRRLQIQLITKYGKFTVNILGKSFNIKSWPRQQATTLKVKREHFVILFQAGISPKCSSQLIPFFKHHHNLHHKSSRGKTKFLYIILCLGDEERRYFIYSPSYDLSKRKTQ